MGKYLMVGAGCLVAGFFIGFFVANNINRSAGLPNETTQLNSPVFNQQQQAVSVKEPSGAMMPDVTETLTNAKNQPEDFEAQMKAGELYLKIQNSAKAAPYFEAAAALKPTDRDKIVRLGNAFFDIRQFEKAQPFYEQALRQKSDDLGVRTDYGITFSERAQPDYDRAIQEFQAALKQNPKHEAALFNMSLAYHRKGDAENAKKYLAELEKANPSSQLVGRLKQILSAN